MDTRSSRLMVTYSHPFSLAGYPDKLPAGAYEIIVEEELLQGLSFVAYRTAAIYLLIHGRGGQAGRTELRMITQSDLETAQSRASGFDRKQQP
ncbi:hypothetical protein K3725_17340 [Leisingera sp. S132]|uniref:hypothetical protein n=1 Tax=Leisingera sp. S132 TaxID=2867016 RepID=UPI0021A6ACEA|nr:hypothetical protein [Leisingera sp. S132]UWQ79048.1 hypothetical protein K3725_17340 [Leisingera sp. S132]